MQQTNKICHKIVLNSPKDRQAYLRREEQTIQNTPKIIVGKLENNLQQIWSEDLKNQAVIRLKQLNSNERAYCYARCIILACKRLASRYGLFLINQNMVFLNEQRKVFVWINPDLLENTVKIYLPTTPEGEAMMTRSIVTFLRLWLKCDYAYLAEAKHLEELLMKFDILLSKNTEGFRPKSKDKKFVGSHKNVSIMLPEQANSVRFSGNGLKAPELNLLIENRSSREICETNPSKQEHLFKSFSNKHKPTAKKASEVNTSEKQGQIRNKTTLSRNTDHASEKNVDFNQGDFEIKSFNSINHITKLSINQSANIKGNQYFPNRTTSNKSHPIVSLINSQNGSSNEYKENRLLVEDEEAEAEGERRKARESLDGIGEEINELFFSNIESDGHKQEQMKKIEEEFGNLLN